MSSPSLLTVHNIPASLSICCAWCCSALPLSRNSEFHVYISICKRGLRTEYVVSSSCNSISLIFLHSGQKYSVSQIVTNSVCRVSGFKCSLSFFYFRIETLERSNFTSIMCSPYLLRSSLHNLVAHDLVVHIPFLSVHTQFMLKCPYGSVLCTRSRWFHRATIWYPCIFTFGVEVTLFRKLLPIQSPGLVRVACAIILQLKHLTGRSVHLLCMSLTFFDLICWKHQ